MIKGYIPTRPARNAADAKHPQLWQGLDMLWAPSLGADPTMSQVISSVVYHNLNERSGRNLYGIAATASPTRFGRDNKGPNFEVTSAGNFTATGFSSSDRIFRSNNSVTIIVRWEKTDSTNRESSLFSNAFPNYAGTGSVNAHVPYSDGTVYWDWGGQSGGNRTSVGGLTVTGDNIWAFTVGARSGMEIWQNGEIKATQASGTRPSLVPSSNQFCVGGLDTFGYRPDTGKLRFLGIWNRQLSGNEIKMLSANEHLLFEPSRVVRGKSVLGGGFMPTRFFSMMGGG